MRPTWSWILLALLLVFVGGAARAAAPVLLSVDIDRTARSYATGVVRYGEKFTVKVSDADYTSNLGCVTITDSGDPATTVTLSFCRGQGTQINNTSASFVWTKPDAPTPPRAAPYRFSVRDLNGNTDSVVTGAPPAMGPLQLALLAPATDSVIYTTPPTAYRPTFQWQRSSGTTKLEVYEEGTQNLIWSRPLVAGAYSVLYANGGTVYYGRTQLLQNRSYLWSINSGSNVAVYTLPAVGGVHTVNVKDWQEVHGRFAVYGSWGAAPLPPALPGRLAYGNQTMTPIATARYTSGIMGFTADPFQRSWLGPELSDFPDWSPDGRALLSATPLGLCLDDLSGNLPLVIAGTAGSDTEGRWVPGGQRILFSRWTADSDYDVWIANVDGSGAQPLVGGPTADRYPAPSPDGRWVAYQRAFDSYTSSLRVVRSTGADDHQIVATGVLGREASYAVVSLAEPAWSPDGTSLAVIFRAQATGLPDLMGVGTLSPAGGPVTPLFISSFTDCCAYPQTPAWSPDGRQVAFSSAHHRSTLSGYAIANALELWLVNADGSSSEPVQLTNDASMSRHLSWWGPNTYPGQNVFALDGVSVTFTSVLEAGSTSLLFPDQAPAPVPGGYEAVTGLYELATTASYSGPITVTVAAAVLPVLPNESLAHYALLQRNGGAWVDVTVPGGNDALVGQCEALGSFLVARVLPPVASFNGLPVQGVAPLAVSFSDTSTGGPTCWAWSFGDGGASDQQHPSHEYTAPGLYSVALVVSGRGGTDTYSRTDYINVLMPPPVAAFSATPVSGTTPLTVSFSDASTGSPTAWSWSFGDGGTSSQQHPQHTYAAAGMYSVALTVTNDGGSSTETKANLIAVTVPPPTAAFSADVTSGCVPLSVQFTDQSTGAPTSWSWDFGDGGASAERNPSHVYLAPGTYTVTLVAGNEGGTTTESKVGCVTALVPPPVAGFTLTPGSGVAPLPVQFTDTSTGAPTTWAWDFGDGALSGEQHPAHLYTAPGTYTVSLTAGNAGGTSTQTQVGCVTVLGPRPVASFTFTPVSGTVPLTVQFTDTSANGPSAWLWDFGDGTTSTEQHPSHTYATVGTFSISLLVINGVGSDSVTVADAISVAGPAWEFIGPLGQIRADGTSVFGRKPFLTVAFQLRYADGTSYTSADADLLVAPVTGGVVGSYLPAPSKSGPDNSFVYSKGRYEFDLSTRTMGPGIWSLQVTVDGKPASEFRITVLR